MQENGKPKSDLSLSWVFFLVPFWLTYQLIIVAAVLIIIAAVLLITVTVIEKSFLRGGVADAPGLLNG